MTKPKRLTSLNGVRRFLAAAVGRLESDEISEGRARCLAYMCQCLAQLLKDGDLEARLKKLEEMEATKNEHHH